MGSLGLLRWPGFYQMWKLCRWPSGMLPSSGEWDLQTDWESWQWIFKRKRKRKKKRKDEESQDMFAPTQENPFLASRELPKAPMLPSQSKEKARNPFAKCTENASSPSTQGFIFDSVDKCETTPTEEKRGFGERGVIHSKANSAEKDKFLRKPLVPMKENATDGELK